MKTKTYFKFVRLLSCRLTCLVAMMMICTISIKAQVVQTITSNGPFTVPSGVTSLKIEAWGTGGSGGGVSSVLNNGGGGGGGGAYNVATIGVNQGDIYNITIGAIGSTGTGAGGPGGATTVTGPLGFSLSANGGLGGAANNGAGGGGGTGNKNGGAGGPGAAANGAGGGGGAGNNANGTNGANNAAGVGGAGNPNVAPYIGGNGGANRSSNGNGNGGIIPSGGGGGGRGNLLGSANGGPGARGQVVLTYTLPAPDITSLGSAGGCVGNTITINGTSFTGATAANVQIGGTPVTAIISNTGTQIIATIGNGTTGTVSVTTTSGTGTSIGTFTVFPLPSAPAVTPPSATVIAGQTASFTASGSGVSFAWYSALTGGTLLASTIEYTPPAACANATFFAEQTSSDGCTSPRTSTTLTRTSLTAPPSVTNGSVCGLGSVTISAVPATGGNSCNWYDAASGGNLLLPNATSGLVTINASGTYTFYASTVITGLGCESTARTAVTATSLPQLIANPVVSPTAACPGSNVSLSNGVSRSGKSIVSVAIPQAILGTTNANSPLTVSDFSSALNNTSVKINYVKVNITHSSVAALRVRLVAPDAGVFNLTNQNGSGANFTNTVFQTGGAAISSGTAPYTGTFAPQQAFSNFNGKNPNGIWTLNVQNVATLISPAGNILNWEINFIDANGITYSWTSTPPGFTSALPNPSDVLSQSTVYNLTANGPGGCTTNASVTANTSPLPDAQISSNAPVCVGIQLTLFGYNSAGGQTSGNTWLWSGPSFSSSSQNPVINIPSLANSGTYTLTITNSFGCTASTTTDVTINPNPVLSIGPQTNVSCNGLSDGLVDIDATSGTPSYLFELVDQFSVPVGPPTTNGVFGSLTAGVYTAAVTDVNGCVATPLAVTITEPNVLTVSAGSNTPVCSATSLNLSATPAGGTSGYSYIWTGPNGAIPSVQNPTIASVTVSDAGNYSVQVTDAHLCTAVSANHLVQVIAFPTAAIALVGSPNKCLGQPVSVSLTLTGTGPWSCTIPTASYNGVSDSTYTILTSPANVNITPATGGTHIYTVSQVAIVGCPPGGTSSGSATVNVSTAAPTPVSGPIPVGAASDACAGTVMLITSNVIPGQNILYSWNTGSHSSVVEFSANIGGPWSAGPFQTTVNQVYAKFGALGGGQSGYYICLQGVNGCGSTINKCLWLRGVVNGPGPITPPDGVVACPNTTQTYSCGLSNGGTIYTWTLNGSTAAITPNGGNNPTNVSVAFPNGFTSGQLCVTAALSCGGASTSPPRCININKNPANPNVPTGAAAACPGTTGPYSIPATPGASGYNWTVPANATIATGANSPSITVNFPTPFTGSSSVCVTTTSACGASAAKCKTVVSGIPNQPAGITGPLTNVCGSTVQYSVVNPIAFTYTWTIPSGTTISGSATGSTILLNVSPAFTSGYLTVVANSALCPPATSAPRTSSTFWGRPNNPGAITANPSVWCSGGFVNFSVISAAPLPIYNWTVSNGTLNAGQGSNNIDVTWGANTAGTITVRASNGCGLSAGTSSQNFSSGCREEGINTSSAAAFSIYPNPAHDKITVSIYVKEQTDLNMKLRDMSGRIVLSEDRQGGEGLNVYNMDLKGFAKGIYMLEIQSAIESWKTKVVVE